LSPNESDDESGCLCNCEAMEREGCETVGSCSGASKDDVNRYERAATPKFEYIPSIQINK